MKRSTTVIIGGLMIAIGLFLKSCSDQYGYVINDNGKVYYNTWNEGQGKVINYIDSVDAATFKELKHSNYAIDKNYVYYKQYRLKGADPKTFVVVSEFYGKDRRFAFQEEKRIDGADGKSFEVIKMPYSKDKNDFYYDTVALKADIKTFKIFNERWAKDRYHYYTNGWICPIFDYKTFTVLDFMYAKDKYKVYCGDTTIANADPVTFKGNNDGSSEDKYAKYDGYQRTKKP